MCATWSDGFSRLRAVVACGISRRGLGDPRDFSRKDWCSTRGQLGCEGERVQSQGNDGGGGRVVGESCNAKREKLSVAGRRAHGPGDVRCPEVLAEFHDSHPPLPHPYTRASSAFSAVPRPVVRLYARSCQLPTYVPLASRFGDQLAFCRFGCPT